MFREITINAVANGWIVQVGCQRFVYDDPQVLIKDIRDYLDNPVDKEEVMLKTCRNAKWTAQAPPTPTPAGVYNGPDHAYLGLRPDLHTSQVECPR